MSIPQCVVAMHATVYTVYTTVYTVYTTVYTCKKVCISAYAWYLICVKYVKDVHNMCTSINNTQVYRKRSSGMKIDIFPRFTLSKVLIVRSGDSISKKSVNRGVFPHYLLTSILKNI